MRQGQQGDDGVSERPVGCLRPSGQQEPQEAVEPFLGEAFTVHLGVGQLGEQVAGRFGPPGLDERCQVLRHRRRSRQPGLRVERTVVDLLGPGSELLVVLERYAHDPADHLHRVVDGEVGNEVCPTGRPHRIEQSADDRLDQLGAPPFEVRPTEGRRHEVAVLAVLLAVERQDEVAHERPHEIAVDGRREGAPVPQDGCSVHVAQDMERAGVLPGLGLDRHDRAVPAGLGPHRMGLGGLPLVDLR